MSTIFPLYLCTDEATCHSQLLDIAFILDASGSVTPPDFVKAKTFASDIVSSFTVTPDKVRVAMLTYSGNVQVSRD